MKKKKKKKPDHATVFADVERAYRRRRRDHSARADDRDLPTLFFHEMRLALMTATQCVNADISDDLTGGLDEFARARAALVELAAVAVATIESLDRKLG